MLLHFVRKSQEPLTLKVPDDTKLSSLDRDSVTGYTIDDQGLATTIFLVTDVLYMKAVGLVEEVAYIETGKKDWLDSV